MHILRLMLYSLRFVLCFVVVIWYMIMCHIPATLLGLVKWSDSDTYVKAFWTWMD